MLYVRPLNEETHTNKNNKNTDTNNKIGLTNKRKNVVIYMTSIFPIYIKTIRI